PGGLGEPVHQPVPLGVGALGQPAEVDVDPLGGAHQPAQRPGAEPGAGVAVPGGLLQVSDEQGVRAERGGANVFGGVGGHPGGEAARGGQQRLGDGGAHPVQCGERGVHRRRPGLQVAQPGGVAPTLRGVVPVVAGQVELVEVEQRVEAVLLQLAQGVAERLLLDAGVRLLVRVVEGVPGAHPGEPVAHPARGEVAGDAVVLAPSGTHPHPGHAGVDHGAEPLRWVVQGTGPDPRAGPPNPEAARHVHPCMDGIRGLLRRPAVRAVLAAAVLGVLAVGAAAVWLRLSTSGLRATVAETPERPVALVLGAGLNDAGRPMPFLARRLDLAAELYHAGKVEAVLVTGDNGRDEYNETDAMADYLAAVGVPREKIAADYAGFSTWESCARAHRVFGVDA